LQEKENEDSLVRKGTYRAAVEGVNDEVKGNCNTAILHKAKSTMDVVAKGHILQDMPISSLPLLIHHLVEQVRSKSMVY
jgi:hypothetical protein